MTYLNYGNYFVNLRNLVARQPKRNHRAYNFKLPSVCISINLDCTHLEWLACSVSVNTERGRQNTRRSILLYKNEKCFYAVWLEKET